MPGFYMLTALTKFFPIFCGAHAPLTWQTESIVDNNDSCARRGDQHSTNNEHNHNEADN